MNKFKKNIDPTVQKAIKNKYVGTWLAYRDGPRDWSLAF